jgi:hypothetical protein
MQESQIVYWKGPTPWVEHVDPDLELWKYIHGRKHVFFAELCNLAG